MSPGLRLFLLSLFAIGLVAAAGRILYRSLRPSASEREKRRRGIIHERGRMHDGWLTDVNDELIHFTYSVAGVAYNASQEINVFRSELPPDLSSAIGPVTLKYMPRNPANSIVISEGWCGLRFKEKAS